MGQASGQAAPERTVDLSGDLGDEHARWEQYQEALRQGALDQLLAAVAEDPDPVMAAGAVVAALEQVPPGERERWVSVTKDWSNAAFVTRRADELAVLEAISNSGGDEARAVDPEAVDGWSDWLQLRAAVPATSAAVLETLVVKGRTRRIRNRAAEASKRRD